MLRSGHGLAMAMDGLMPTASDNKIYINQTMRWKVEKENENFQVDFLHNFSVEFCVLAHYRMNALVHISRKI